MVAESVPWIQVREMVVINKWADRNYTYGRRPRSSIYIWVFLLDGTLYPIFFPGSVELHLQDYTCLVTKMGEYLFTFFVCLKW